MKPKSVEQNWRKKKLQRSDIVAQKHLHFWSRTPTTALQPKRPLSRNMKKSWLHKHCNNSILQERPKLRTVSMTVAISYAMLGHSSPSLTNKAVDECRSVLWCSVDQISAKELDPVNWKNYNVYIIFVIKPLPNLAFPLPPHGRGFTICWLASLGVNVLQLWQKAYQQNSLSL